MLNLDTNILLYPLSDDLTPRESTLLSNDTWSIAGIVLWEIAKLSELGHIELDLDDSELARTLSRIQTWPLTLDICRAINTLDFDSDPTDEIIAATSIIHRLLWSHGPSDAPIQAHILCRVNTLNRRRAPCSSHIIRKRSLHPIGTCHFAFTCLLSSS